MTIKFPVDAPIENVVKEKALSAAGTLSRFGYIRAIYLFGSQVEGRADEWSDIDVAAFMDGAENWDMKKRACIGARVMIEVDSDVEVHLFPASALENPGRGSFAEYILRHGVSILEMK